MDKKYDFRTVEKEMQELWEKEEVYAFRKGADRKIFSIDTPPPTVSGSLHIGHVFSYTQAEIVARFKRMQGFDVFYPFGFDDNGLPTERLVEKDQGIRAGEIQGSEFRKRCLQTVKEYEEEFKLLLKSLGYSVDWSLTYQTISDKAQRISQRSFLELVKKGKAYVKESPVLWCTECRTSIAQAELDTKETESVFYYLRFETKAEPLIIATTRPELLYGCACIFINTEDERYKSFLGMSAKVPLYGFEIPIMADELVAKEKGTGAVMCATFGDSTDVEWFHKHKLPYKKIITEEGKISTETPYIGGMSVRQAREEIVNRLEEAGLILKKEPITHSVAIHERCSHETEILTSRQWYIDIMSEKEQFLKAADEINWHPEYMKSRYRIWVENLKWDWCISRQRYFGVPFPLWYCKECGRPILAEISRLPVNPKEDSPTQVCECGCREAVPETAVLDTWATSSLTPLINAGYWEEDNKWENEVTGERFHPESAHSESVFPDIFHPESDHPDKVLPEKISSGKLLPMSMRSQAHEIIRTWAFYSIVKSIFHTGQIPWKDIMISGFVLAKNREKISKSKNNASNSPLQLIDKHSADAIRYWAASARLGTDTFFDEEDLKVSKRFITKLYNASAFAIYHLSDYTDTDKPSLLPADRWILGRVSEATSEAEKFLNQYEIGQARHIIDELFWKDFCDYYIEIVKERLYQPEKHGEKERHSAQYALYHSLLGILKLYAIYTPHVTEYIYQQFFCQYEKLPSLHSTLWKKEETDRNIMEFGQQLMRIIGEVRKEKAERQVSMKEQIPELIITCTAGLARYFEQTEGDLKACTGAGKILIRS